MNKNWVIALSLSIVTMVQAGKPPIAIEPLSVDLDSPHQEISYNGVGQIVYKVTNKTNAAKPLFFELPVGIIFNNTFNRVKNLPLCNKLSTEGLAPHKSCLLSLTAVAALIRSQGVSTTSGGPIISFARGFSRFEPAPYQRLFIHVSALNASVQSLALSVKKPYAPFYALTGTPRTITLSKGDSPVPNVKFKIEPALPVGTTVSPANGQCGTIASETPCTIIITPGDTPTTFPSTLIVFENERESFHVPIDILDYNSVYQSGYVFSIDDTTPATESVGGSVAALENQAQIFPAGIIWASNGKTNCPKKGQEPYKDCTAYDFISGIDELSTSSDNSCNGNTDGACDTKRIVAYIQSNYGDKTGGIDINTLYAAGLCTQTIGDYTDWYLPAICELGYYQPTPHTPDINSYCGTLEAPLIQNMASNLNTDVLKTMQGPFSSSTEFSCTQDNTCGNAWGDYFTSNTQTHDGKENTLGVRCVRAMTQPTSPSS